MATDRKPAKVEIGYYGPLAGPGRSSITLLHTAAATASALIGAAATVAVTVFLCIRLLPLALYVMREMTLFVLEVLFATPTYQPLAADPRQSGIPLHQR